MANYTEMTFNSVTIQATAVVPFKKQKTIKQIIGRSMIEVEVIGLDAVEWNLQVTAVITGSSLSDLGTKRAAIEALDDSQAHTLVDGIHDGTYYIRPGSLSFSDSGDRGGLSYVYRFELVEQ